MIIYEEIKKIFKNYKVFENIKIEQEEYDCVALSKEINKPDFVFEIKYSPNIKTRNLGEIFNKINIKNNFYFQTTNRSSKSIIIIIVDDSSDRFKLENVKLFEEIDKYNKKNHPFEIAVITDMKKLEIELECIHIS